MTFEPLWAPWEQFRPKKGPKNEKQNQKALSETLAMPKSYFDSILDGFGCNYGYILDRFGWTFAFKCLACV